MRAPSSSAAAEKAPHLRVTLAGKGEIPNFTLFTKPFRIGRTDECEFCIPNDYVSRVHAEVRCENDTWWIHDNNSSNGIFLDGQRVDRVAIKKPLTLRLGIEGPDLFFQPEIASQAEPIRVSAKDSVSESLHRDLGAEIKKSEPGSGTILRKYVNHYFSNSAGDIPASEHTLYVRRAFAAVQTRQKRRYARMMTAVSLLALCGLGYGIYEWRQLQ